IMGGVDAEVDDSTTDLVLEAAYFRAASIRWTSRKLGLSSDSSYRFERGVDPYGPAIAARRAIDLILEIAGGRLEAPAVKVGSEPVWKNEIFLSPDFVRAKAGFPIADESIREVLESLELAVAREEAADDGRGTIWTVRIPSFRSDL